MLAQSAEISPLIAIAKQSSGFSNPPWASNASRGLVVSAALWFESQ